MARKILLADDSVTAQNMGRKILADAGYEVIAVNNGSAALKKIAELKPDLVILDVYMPGYSGLEVCQRLKESQETARIPVLLTVGKLEPFKPEEAQRVRAEGFIVKPFEASELLSTLSKLEDKVVPRAEPSKPGRFARAIAAAEEVGRGGRYETTSDDNGWKTRIGFPHEKTGEEKAADAALDNPVNREVRRVVETATEKPAERKEAKPQPAAETVESSVDVAALVPEGLPKDVTPEEVAAIASAAAQIQMAGAALKSEHPVSGSGFSDHQISEMQISEMQVSEARVAEPRVSENRASEITSPAMAEPAPHRSEATLPSPPDVQVDFRGDFASHVNADAKTEALQESKIESVAEEFAAPETDHRRNGDESSEETQDLPVTMAAGAESIVAANAGSRWTAVPVALEGDESSISLDQEMRKAYAAFSAAVAESEAVAAKPEVAASAENSSAWTEASGEAAVTAASSPELEPAGSAAPAPVAQSEAAAVAASFVATNFPTHEPGSLAEAPSASSQQPEAAALVPVTAEVPPIEAYSEASPAAERAEPHPEPLPLAEFGGPVEETGVADFAAPGAQELTPAPEAEPAVLEAAPSNSLAPIVRSSEPAAEPKLDPETVKNTAAAWASWRQVHDTSKGSEVVQAQPREFEVPESTSAETAAMGAAAGAEQIFGEASAVPSDSPADVASIVDSVLADLRPKLMAEISRKMAEKK